MATIGAGMGDLMRVVSRAETSAGAADEEGVLETLDSDSEGDEEGDDKVGRN